MIGPSTHKKQQKVFSSTVDVNLANMVDREAILPCRMRIIEKVILKSCLSGSKKYFL